jgi:adenylate kinase
LIHLSTGDLLRAEVYSKTEIGQKVEAIMSKGDMVPLPIVLNLLKSAINRNRDAHGFLIDGFPRTFEQAVIFENTVGPCRAVVYFKCPFSILESRLLSRGISSGRADDNLQTIQNRIGIFESQSMEVIEYYKFKGCCIEISSDHPIEDVYQDARLVFLSPEPLHLKNIVFVMGGPGSGKGTQCLKLKEKFGYVHISTGDLLREQVQMQTPIGVKVADIMKKGDMVPRVHSSKF